MENLHEKITELKLKIIKAFENVSVPNGLVAEHECEECFEIRNIFTGKDWRTLTPEILEANYDKLPLFSHEAYHCFLPAYLIYALDSFGDNMVFEFTSYNFMCRGKNEKDDIEWRKNRFQFFTKEQLYVAYEFIDLLIQEEEHEEFRLQLENGKQILTDYVEPNLKI